MIAAGRRSKTSSYRFCNVLFVDLRRAERFDEDAHRVRDADRVGDLHFAAIGQPRRDDVLRDPSRRVGGRTIDLGRIFSGERAAAVTRHSAVRVGDNFAAGQAGIALRTADDETSGRVDVDARLSVAHRRRDDVIDDFLGDFVTNDFERDIGIVLRRDDDRIDANGLIAVVLDRDLRLAIGPQIGNVAVFAHSRQGGASRLCASTIGSGINSSVSRHA